MLTINEVKERLAKIDEISLMDLLEITSEDLCERFLDKIEIKYDQLLEELEVEEQEDDPWSYENLND